MTIELVPGGRVKVSSPTPSFTQVRPPSAPAALVIPGGERGPAGRSIVSVVWTSGTGEAGTTDTYTITFSDDTTTTFDVYNGADGASGVTSVNGKTGPVVVLAASDVGAVPTARTVTAGTGLTGGGDLSANRTLAVSFGTAAGTAAQGSDSRIVNAVPNTRTVNTKALSANITLAAADVGAAANTGGGREKVAALSATTGTATGDVSAASIFTITPTGNFTVAFSNIPASDGVTITLIISSGATAYTPTFPAATDWGVTSPPTLTANKSTIVTFLTVNGGTKLHARAS